MKKSNKELFKEFLESKFTFYRDINEKLIRFDYTEISNWRLRLMIFWHEQVLNYKVYEMDKSLLDKVLTIRNRNVSMSLKQRFKSRELKIIKFHKFKGKDLVKYKLFIIGQDFSSEWIGIKANIL